MAAGQENKSPSVAELQKYIREKTTIEFHLSNGEKLVGTIRWFDDHCFALTQPGDERVTVQRHAILSYRTHK